MGSPPARRSCSPFYRSAAHVVCLRTQLSCGMGVGYWVRVSFWFDTVLGTSGVDDFLHGWNAQVYVDHGIVDIPRGLNNCLQYFRLASLYVLILCFRASQYKSNETPTWCDTVQVLFLQSHSTCFGRKRPSSGVFKTSTVATGTCVIVAGKSSHLLIRAFLPE